MSRWVWVSMDTPTIISGVHKEKFRGWEEWSTSVPSARIQAYTCMLVAYYTKISYLNPFLSKSLAAQHYSLGRDGSGKSSTINMIVGADVATVSSGPRGCTFENESYEARLGDAALPYLWHCGILEHSKGWVVPQTLRERLQNVILPFRSDWGSLMKFEGHSLSQQHVMSVVSTHTLLLSFTLWHQVARGW